MSHLQRWLDRIYTIVCLLIVGLLPLVTFPLASNVFEIPKLIFLVSAIGLLVIIKAFSILTSGKLDLKYSVLDIPLLLWAIVYIASSFIVTSNKMEAVMYPGITTYVVCAVILYLLLNQMTHKKYLVYTLLTSGGLYALSSILSKTGIVTVLPIFPQYVHSNIFTPGGGYLPSALYLLMLLPLAIISILFSKEFKLQILGVVSGILLLFGIGLSIYQLTPGKTTSLRLPSYLVSWSVATEALANSPLFGVGPGSYLTAFNRFRPLTYNNSELWNVKYMTASSFLLTLITETGLIGLVVALFCGVVLIRSIRSRLKKDIYEQQYQVMSGLFATIIGLVTLVLLPVANFVIVMYLVLVTLMIKTKTWHLSLSIKTEEDQVSQNKIPAIILAGVLVLVVIGVYFVGGRFAYAEIVYASSLQSVSQNKAQDAFGRMTKAVQLNPIVDRYRMSFSQLSFVLANAVASKATGENAQSITDQERQQITQLIQLSIQEAKAGVALNPYRSGNWEVLGRTYSSIIPLAKGADQFALQAYAQAIILDPNNPNLRVILGQLLYTTKQFEQAQRVLELAVAAKPDYANARFNLAYVYSSQNKLDPAIVEMKKVLTLVAKDSNDEKIAAESLKTLEEKKKLQTEQTGENLTAPDGEVDQVITPPVELTKEDEPPPAPVLEPDQNATPSAASSTSPTPRSSPAPSAS